METIEQELTQFISKHVQEGFDSAHAIIESARHYALEQFGRDDLLPLIKQLTFEMIAAHQAEQAGWGATTDCDRLDAAFAALKARGIVARQDFSCCLNCGFEEIWDEVEGEEEQQEVIGYVFYDLQSTERVMTTGQLLLAYGSVEEDQAQFSQVGNSIMDELRSAGLDASWGGTDLDPIVVNGMIWRRRRRSESRI